MLAWLETLPVSEWVSTSDWGYPLLLAVHSMGMGIVVGILVMLDLRLLGVARGIPLSAFERLVPVAWGGFALNLVSGVLLFMSMASRLAVNWPFLSKLAAIAVGGIITWMLWRSIRRDAGGAGEGAGYGAGGALAPAGSSLALHGQGMVFVSGRTRALAVVSLGVWMSAILFGRLIAYVLDAMLLSGEI